LFGFLFENSKSQDTILEPVFNSFSNFGRSLSRASGKRYKKEVFIKSKYLLNSSYLLLATIVLLTGSLDHYWWTLPQNQLIIVLALALLSNMSNTSYKTNKTHELF